MEERSTDKLARYTLYAAAFALAAFLCWYFRSVLVYIIVAFIVSGSSGRSRWPGNPPRTASWPS